LANFRRETELRWKNCFLRYRRSTSKGISGIRQRVCCSTIYS
jgi:hypothetical protein